MADNLILRNISTRIIESNEEKAAELASQFPEALVLEGDGTDEELQKEAGVPSADYFIALTRDDELNILSSLLAKHLGTKKAICTFRKQQYAPVIESIGIDSVINPRVTTANEIFRLIHKKDTLSVFPVEGGQAQMVEFVTKESSHVAGKPLSEINFPKDSLVGAIVREDEVIIPKGNEPVLPGDRVIIFAMPHALKGTKKLFGVK